MPSENKNHHQSYENIAPLIFTEFNTAYLYEDNYNTGRAIRHSKNGLSFITQAALTPGAMILIKLSCKSSDNAGSDAWDGFRTISMAKVERCTPTDDKSGFNFLINASYYHGEH